MARSLFSKPIHTNEDRNHPPSANQEGFLQLSPEADCTPQVQTPTSPSPALSAGIAQGHYQN